MAKTWTRTELTETIGNAEPVDEYAKYDSCFKDNTLKFLDDNKMTLDAGMIKCDPNDPQTSTDKWILEGKHLTMGVRPFSTMFTIQELTESKLVVKFYQTTLEGVLKVTCSTYEGK
jgi:hypothetical protein